MRFVRLAIVLGLAVVLAGTASAQQQQRQQQRQRPGGQPGGAGGFGGFGGGFGGGSLAGLIGTSKQLQDELKMDKDEVEKVTAAMTKVREDLRDETAKLRDRNTSAGDRTEITKKVTEANDKALAAVLKPEQLKRLHQIENQRAGVNMYTKEDVQKTLKLSDEQKEKVSTITKDLQKDLRDLAGRGGAPDPEAQKKRQGLQQEAKDSVAKLLSDEQKSAVKDLTGEPFELQLPNFGGGAGGFAGGFGRPSTPGQILSSTAQETLKLTDEQKKELEAIQKDADSKLEKLLTEDQKKQFKEMKDNAGRGGRGGAGGTGGRPGRPGANPPQ